MKRVLVVDDEQPVVDYIVRIVERELNATYVVAGTAASGRETLERVADTRPDIIVLDVRMPGLSGLDTVRELKRRGSRAAFVLSTAYERFDIAREALELGIAGYLLKPVSKEALAQALQAASDVLDRRATEQVPSAPLEWARAWAAEAFLHGLLVGRPTDLPGIRETLGLSKPWGLVGVAVSSRPESFDRERFASALEYKASVVCGPLVAGRCAFYVPLSSAEAAADLVRTLSEAEVPSELGTFRFGFSEPHAADQMDGAWEEALRSLAAPGRSGATLRSFEAEGRFFRALSQQDGAELRAAFDALLLPFEAGSFAVEDRYRVIALLGAALAQLAASRALEEAEVLRWFDFDDLRDADIPSFCLFARSRLPAITGALHRSRRWSAVLTASLDSIRRQYGSPLTLDSVADEVGVSPKRLSKHFIDELGQGFSDYLIEYRIEQAKLMLALPGASIKQVSKDCGYPDPNYFARLFKKVTGQTPTEFSSGISVARTATS